MTEPFMWQDVTGKKHVRTLVTHFPGSTTSVIGGSFATVWNPSVSVWSLFPVVGFEEEWEEPIAAQDALIGRLTEMLHQARRDLEALEARGELEVPEILELHPLTTTRTKAKIRKTEPASFRFIRE
jgi:hypothetical protein